jgi:hypothetical protein
LLLWLITLRLPALDFTCTTNNGSITITGYTGPGKVVIIPSTMDGLRVTSIDGRAFSGCTNLTNIKIPNSITSIGRGVFEGYSGLIEVYQAPSIGSQVPVESGTNLWTERLMFPLAKGQWFSTAVGYQLLHTNISGPWSRGNCLTFEGNPTELDGRRAGMADVVRWRVFNIHTENFFEITKRLGLKSVEAEVVHRRVLRQTTTTGHGPETVQIVDDGDCIITDARIPREWLRSTPETYYSKADWRQYLATYPDKFNVAEEK